MKRADRIRVVNTRFRCCSLVAVGREGSWSSWLLTLALIWPIQAAAEFGPAQLARMAAALRSLSYQGTLVYLHDNRIESLRVVRRVENGQVRERLVSLNGPARTLTRADGGVTCRLSGSHSISVPDHGIGGKVFQVGMPDPGMWEDHYRVRASGEARVAGRHTEVVEVVPRDRLRYGYRFYLDRESGLPLKSDLLGPGPGPGAEPIEQVMFTSLELLPSRGSASTTGAAPRRKLESPVPDSSPWRFDSLPSGFILVMHDAQGATGGQPMDHFLFSDGLASLSVYVEPDPREGLEGDTRIGAVHAAGKRVSGHQVTVIGEVPLETVEAMLAGVRRVQRNL